MIDLPGDPNARFHQGLATYVAGLLALGEPAVQSLKPIVGAQRNRAFVREVMLGLEEHASLRV